MRSAADIDDVGWPDPAAVVARMLSIASCAARSFQSAVRSSTRSSIFLATALPAYRRADPATVSGYAPCS